MNFLLLGGWQERMSWWSILKHPPWLGCLQGWGLVRGVCFPLLLKVPKSKRSEALELSSALLPAATASMKANLCPFSPLHFHKQPSEPQLPHRQSGAEMGWGCWRTRGWPSSAGYCQPYFAHPKPSA